MSIRNPKIQDGESLDQTLLQAPRRLLKQEIRGEKEYGWKRRWRN
jgi:hypothetical protein